MSEEIGRMAPPFRRWHWCSWVLADVTFPGCDPMLAFPPGFTDPQRAKCGVGPHLTINGRSVDEWLGEKRKEPIFIDHLRAVACSAIVYASSSSFAFLSVFSPNFSSSSVFPLFSNHFSLIRHTNIDPFFRAAVARLLTDLFTGNRTIAVGRVQCLTNGRKLRWTSRARMAVKVVKICKDFGLEVSEPWNVGSFARSAGLLVRPDIEP